MEHEQPSATTPSRSFFQSPSFWIGGLLWLAVFGAIALSWNRNREELTRSNPQSSGPQARDIEPTAETPEPKNLIITMTKDGSTSVVDAADINPDSPWDKDGIADFAFTDTEGKTVTKADLLGKPWIVCFVFTHCALTCPTVTNSMRELQDRLKDYDFRLVTLTVDPDRDTAEILKQYGKDRGADFNRWSFLRADQRDIYRLIHGSFKMPVQELPETRKQPGFEFIHSNNIMLVDENGVIRGKFDATKGPAMSSLRREIQKLAKPLRGDPATQPEPQPDPEPSL
jgi:cytochrome oxidase Cu insertion factor (SCO1/SenC/PrrC family)